MAKAQTLLVLLVLLSLGACRARPAAIAPSSTPISNGEHVVLGDVDGSAWGVMLFFIPIHGHLTERARDNAIAQIEGASGLVNVTVDYNLFSLVLVTLTRANVHGQAFKTLD